MGDSEAASAQSQGASILTVPDDGDTIYPTLGPQVCDWMEANLVYGPGDLRGDPLVLDDEQRAIIYRCYEVMPAGHAIEGRRRFRRCALSLAKGLRKTEIAAFVAAAELDNEAPVRFDGWDGYGEPVGRPVKDPFVILVAYTEEQSDELAYGALRVILEESPIADRFDIGLERIMRAKGDGKAISLAGSPNARDGARTTFSVHDETHWHTLDKLKRAHQVMLNNLAKRKLSDPWALEVTTAYEPGAGSIAESTMDYARTIAEGRASDARLFFFHRQASDEHDLETEEDARAAVTEASGAAASWRDIESIVDLWRDPTTDRRFWERVWCNRPVQAGRRAFDLTLFKSLEREQRIPDGALITIGFDGAQFHDATAIVCTDIRTGFVWLAGAWENPGDKPNWQVPADEVEDVLADLFERYNVFRMYADPPYWQSYLSKWQGAYGDERIIEWWTNRRRQMASALESFSTSIEEGTLSHNGDELLVRHIGNAQRHELPYRDDEARPLWLMRKDKADSPRKIDAAMAAVLSWEARKDAIALGYSGGVGTVFAKEWLKYWQEEPTGGNRYILVHAANDKKPHPKTTAMWVLEARSDRGFYAVEMVRDELNVADRIDLLFELHRKHDPLRVGYEKRGLEQDSGHIEDRQSRENYRFQIDELAGHLTEHERVERLVPLFEAGRIVLPEAHKRDGVDMVAKFRSSEYEAFPYGQHADMLDLLSRILDMRTEFPSEDTYIPPEVFPSDWD